MRWLKVMNQISSLFIIVITYNYSGLVIIVLILLNLFNFIVSFIDSSSIDLPSLTILTIGDYSFQTLTQYEIEGRGIKESIKE